MRVQNFEYEVNDMATEKNLVNMKSEKASDIHGFGIELNKERLTRIDRMVESYEKRVTARLDEEYSERKYPAVN